jgi:hypothetical protein
MRMTDTTSFDVDVRELFWFETADLPEAQLASP